MNLHRTRSKHKTPILIRGSALIYSRVLPLRTGAAGRSGNGNRGNGESVRTDFEFRIANFDLGILSAPMVGAWRLGKKNARRTQFHCDLVRGFLAKENGGQGPGGSGIGVGTDPEPAPPSRGNRKLWVRYIKRLATTQGARGKCPLSCHFEGLETAKRRIGETVNRRRGDAEYPEKWGKAISNFELRISNFEANDQEFNRSREPFRMPNCELRIGGAGDG